MIRIGDFSTISRVPIKTLRYYDEMGLLKPVKVDPATGYRFYEFSQLEKLHRILALKDLGFSLEEIGQLLSDGLSLEQMRGMLRLRETEARQRVRNEMDRLQRVEVRLKQLEQENTMSKYEVVIKKIEGMKIASVRGVIPTPPEQGPMWDEVEGCLAAQHVKATGPCLSLYHDEGYKERDWDIEVCEPVSTNVKETTRVKVRELPAVESMACTVHHGPFITIGESYNSLGRWIDENGYRIIGPAREVYLRPSNNGSQTDPETVTEIQFPVQKA